MAMEAARVVTARRAFARLDGIAKREDSFERQDVRKGKPAGRRRVGGARERDERMTRKDARRGAERACD
jgi:hypothetical protein